MAEGETTHDPLASVFVEPHTTTIAEESITDFWHEAIPLMCANHAEVGGLPAEHFDPKLSTFQGIEAAGMLKCYTMRLGGRLIGYGVFALTPHLHYPALKVAVADVVYVTPERRGRRSIRFLRWIKRELKAAGAHFWGLQNPASKDWAHTLHKLGLAPMETFYVGDLR